MKNIKPFFIGRLVAYAGLYRPDVALISLFSYLVGSRLAGSMDLQDLIMALLVSLVSMNFIYSFNSWSDWKLDKINKPHRPIPSGRLKPGSAFAYSMVLLALSVIYPLVFFLFLPSESNGPYIGLLLFLLLPLLGLMYSAEPVRLKKRLWLAVVATSMMLVIPMMLGFYMNEQPALAAATIGFQASSSMPFFFLALFIFCLAAIPLKDIEDAAGDKEFNSKNLFIILGKKRLLLLSLFLLLADFLLACFLPLLLALRIYLLAITISAAIIIMLFLFSSRSLSLKKLYKSIIWAVLIEGFLLFLFLSLGILGMVI